MLHFILHLNFLFHSKFLIASFCFLSIEYVTQKASWVALSLPSYLIVYWSLLSVSVDV